MSKRKCDERDFAYLSRKIKKLEKKLNQSKRRRILSSESSSADSSPQRSIPEDSEQVESYILADDEIENYRECTPEQCVQYTSVETNSGQPLTEIGITDQVDPLTVPDIQSNNKTPEPILDQDILEILGEDPLAIKGYGNEIQKDLAIRLENIATKGIPKETKKELLEKYQIPVNCKLIDAPILNAELKAAASDIVVKRDKAIAYKQKQTAAAISSLGAAISLLIKSKEKNPPLLKLLMDTGRILCDCQYLDTLTRRNYILNGLKKDMKDHLLTTNVDSHLFGQNLSETLKSAKAINKSGAELKSTPAVKASVKKQIPTSSKPLNWRGPPPARRQPGTQRTKEPALPRPRQTNSSKRSYSQPSSSRSRR